MKIEEPSFYQTRIRDWPEDERPREKLINLGPEYLTNSELLAILLRSGSRSQTAVDLAKTVINRLGDLHQISQLNFRKFSQLKGIGTTKAVTLVTCFELARRIVALPVSQKIKISSPEIVHQKYGSTLSHLKKEIFMVLLLNSANILLRDLRISEGTLNASLVHPREVFADPLTDRAAAIILAHNHPSGSVDPSAEDDSITRRLVDVGQTIGIPVLDHVVFGTAGYFSYLEQNAL